MRSLTHTLCLLLAALLGIVVGTLLWAATAMAAETPSPSPIDPRSQSLTYVEGQIYQVPVAQGGMLAIILPKNQTDNHGMAADPRISIAIPQNTNTIWIKPNGEVFGPKQVFITAKTPDGGSKLYPFQLNIGPPGSEGPYTVTFKDPAAVTAAQTAWWRKQQAEKAAAEAAAAQRDAVKHPVDTNLRYVLQGKTTADWNLLPTRQVGDDGINTHFYFPGQHNPIIYTVTADGKGEAVPNNCLFDSETSITTCHQLAERWRLRDGDAVLCIYNRAYDPVGKQTPSGTSNPNYQRVPAQAGKAEPPEPDLPLQPRPELPVQTKVEPPSEPRAEPPRVQPVPQPASDIIPGRLPSTLRITTQ